MNKKYRDLLINTLVFFIGNVGSKVVTFLLVPLYTAVLTTNEFGSVDLMTTTVQLLIPILSLNIQDAVLRFALDSSCQRENVFRISSRVMLVSSCVLSIGLIALKKLGIFPFTFNYLLFLFAAFVVGMVNKIFTMYLKAKNKMKIIAVCGVMNTIVTCVINFLLLLGLKMGVNGYMIAYVSGTLAANIGMYVFGDLRNDLKTGRWETGLARLMIIYSFPMIANTLAWWINSASDRYILTWFCGTAINGIYSLSYKIPSILSILQGTFYSAWSVSAITEFDKDDTDGFIGQVFSLYAVASLVLCSGIMLFNIFIACFLYSNEFFVAWKYVPVLLMGTLFNGYALFVGCMFTAAKKTKIISWTTMVGATVNTVFNFALIPIIGAMGAAISTLLGYVVVFTIRLYCLREIVKMKVNWIQINASLLMLGIQCIVATLFENALLQIPFVFMIVAVNRNTFVQMLKDFAPVGWKEKL